MPSRKVDDVLRQTSRRTPLLAGLTCGVASLFDMAEPTREARVSLARRAGLFPSVVSYGSMHLGSDAEELAATLAIIYGAAKIEDAVPMFDRLADLRLAGFLKADGAIQKFDDGADYPPFLSFVRMTLSGEVKVRCITMSQHHSRAALFGGFGEDRLVAYFGQAEEPLVDQYSAISAEAIESITCIIRDLRARVPPTSLTAERRSL